MPHNEIIEGTLIRTDTTIGVDWETAKTIHELSAKYDKTKKAMLRQIIREWMEQEAMAHAELAKFQAEMKKRQRN
jgi:predicted transcriptional regulator